MARVELTDRPCPECGAHLDLHLQTQAIDPKDPVRTAKVVRILVCPECVYTREDDPIKQ